MVTVRLAVLTPASRADEPHHHALDRLPCIRHGAATQWLWRSELVASKLIKAYFMNSSNPRNVMRYGAVERPDARELRVGEAFDSCYPRLEAGDEASVCADLLKVLAQAKARLSLRDWKLLASSLREHPLWTRFQESDFIRHGFAKPRGYPGDATLMDYIYNHGAPPLDTDPVATGGRRVQDVWLSSSTAEAVRRRRLFFARRITEEARRGGAILTVACGHFRELDLIPVHALRSAKRVVAVDQDAVSLCQVHDSYSAAFATVETIRAPAMSFATHDNDIGRFNFVFSAGLFDYLDNGVGRRLTSCLADMLDPGGELVIANYLTKSRMQPLMEVFMDWWLVYRDEHEIRQLGRDLSPEFSLSYREDIEEVGYLTIHRLAGAVRDSSAPSS